MIPLENDIEYKYMPDLNENQIKSSSFSSISLIKW